MIPVCGWWLNSLKPGRNSVSWYGAMLGNPVWKLLCFESNFTEICTKGQLMWWQHYFKQCFGAEEAANHYLNQLWPYLLMHMCVPWLVWCEAITWINVDSESVRYCGIHLRAIKIITKFTIDNEYIYNLLRWWFSLLFYKMGHFLFGPVLSEDFSARCMYLGHGEK